MSNIDRENYTSADMIRTAQIVVPNSALTGAMRYVVPVGALATPLVYGG